MITEMGIAPGSFDMWSGELRSAWYCSIEDEVETLNRAKKLLANLQTDLGF